MTQDNVNNTTPFPTKAAPKLRKKRSITTESTPVRVVSRTIETPATPAASKAQDKEQIQQAAPSACITAFPFKQTAEIFHNQITQQNHTLFAENVKLSKDFFNCKTVNDLFDLQSRILHLNSTVYLNNIVKLTESFFKAKRTAHTGSDKENK